MSKWYEVEGACICEPVNECVCVRVCVTLVCGWMVVVCASVRVWWMRGTKNHKSLR